MPDEVLWYTPLKFSIILEAYRETQKQKMIMAAQSAIFNGAVVRSYFGGGKGRRAKPITKINQLIKFDNDDNSRKTDALSRIKTIEQYNEKLNYFKGIFEKAKNKG
jgi:hypothetical protein